MARCRRYKNLNRLRRALGKLPGVVASALIIVLGACRAGDAPSEVITRPTPSSADEIISVCQQTGSVSRIVQIQRPALEMRLELGDYVTHLIVDKKTSDFPDSVRFRTITAALAAARRSRLAKSEMTTAGCPITITVGPGTYRGSVKATDDSTLERFPLMIDVPAVSLVGAFRMALDKDRRAMGTGDGRDVTTLQPTTPLLGIAQGVAETIIIVNGHPGGSAGNGVTIEGFAFQSGREGDDDEGGVAAGGFGILSIRVRDLVIRGNRFEAGLISAIDLRETSARVETNYTSGGAPTACDMCFAGPGDYYVTGNRLLNGGIDGVFVAPLVALPLPPSVEPYALPATARVTATVVNNDIRDHTEKPVGVAVRLGTIGNSAPNVPTASTLQILDNSIVHNTFGVIVEAAFPLANTTLKGDADVTLAGNMISQSCQANLFVTFTRHATALGAGQLARPYLRNSRYDIRLGANGLWDEAWYTLQPNLEDFLFVDGLPVIPGSRVAYDAARTC